MARPMTAHILLKVGDRTVECSRRDHADGEPCTFVMPGIPAAAELLIQPAPDSIGRHVATLEDGRHLHVPDDPPKHRELALLAEAVMLFGSVLGFDDSGDESEDFAWRDLIEEAGAWSEHVEQLYPWVVEDAQMQAALDRIARRVKRTRP